MALLILLPRWNARVHDRPLGSTDDFVFRRGVDDAEHVDVGVLVFAAVVVSQVFLEVVGMALGIEDLEERIVVVGSIVDRAAGVEVFRTDGNRFERHYDEEEGFEAREWCAGWFGYSMVIREMRKGNENDVEVVSM